MSPRKAVLIHSADFDQYSYPAECPFRTQRAGMAYRTLLSMGLLSGHGQTVLAPQPADRATLETFHSPRYMDTLELAVKGHMGVEGLHMGLGTPETPVFACLCEYASLACGATLLGVDQIVSGQADVAFNMSGGYHHADPAHAAGFCYINDVAIACLRLAEQGKRTLFLDVDAHHGDGVQRAFYGRSDVMTMSFHESGKTLFPGTGFEDEIGVGDGLGYSVNVPLPANTYDGAVLRALHAVALPLVEAYAPDVIVLELGLDGLAGDPLAHLRLTNNAFAEVTSLVLGFGKPLLVTGGGGYHVDNTARGWALAWSIISGEKATQDLSLALGGVMLESTEWLGGLRDRAQIPDDVQRETVDRAIGATVDAVKANVFGIHGL